MLNDKFVLSADTAGNESTDQFDASEKISTNDIDQMMEKLYAKYISNEIPVVIGEFGARDKNGNLQSQCGLCSVLHCGGACLRHEL